MNKLCALTLCMAAYFGPFSLSANTMSIKVVLEGKTLIETEAGFALDVFEHIAVAQTDGSIYIFDFKVTEDELEGQEIEDEEKSVAIYAALSKQKTDGTLDLLSAPHFNTSWNEKASISLTNNTTGRHLSTVMMHPKK